MYMCVSPNVCSHDIVSKRRPYMLPNRVELYVTKLSGPRYIFLELMAGAKSYITPFPWKDYM